jgi:hypothetical protein
MSDTTFTGQVSAGGQPVAESDESNTVKESIWSEMRVDKKHKRTA